MWPAADFKRPARALKMFAVCVKNEVKHKAWLYNLTMLTQKAVYLSKVLQPTVLNQQ